MNASTTTTTQLSGAWLIFGRAVWTVLFLLCLTLLFSSLIIIPPILRDIRENYDGVEAVLAAAPLARRYLLVIAFYVTSFIVFRQRSSDWGALIMASFYASIGTMPVASGIFLLTVGIMTVPPLLEGLAIVALSLAAFYALFAVFVFPDGRFTPTWSRWALIPISLIAIAYAVSFYIERRIPVPVFWGGAFVALVGIYAQIFRYRHTAGQIQRQQIKWYVYGGAAFLIAQGIGVTMHARLGPVVNLTDLLWQLLREIILLFSLVALLVCNLIAIVRYRLFDINFVINRSIVYGAVTIMLGLLFAGVFLGLQAILAAIFGGEQLAVSAGAAGALVILIFQPTRRLVRRFVDRRLYGIELDYTGAGQRERRAPQMEAPAASPAGTWDGFHDMVFLARGGMGEVYRAIHPTQKIPVAVKLLKYNGDSDVEARRRFRREAETVARLRHPHIVALHEIGEKDDDLYMVMEYIPGPTLAQTLRDQQRLSLAETADIIANIADALDYAHEREVVHRDIKPSNVIIEEGTGRAVLMDFGIAKIAAETQLTQTGGMIGTLDYISPEQIQGIPGVDYRSDIYSLGVMTHQMLTGELPFRHGNPGAMVMAHLMQPPPDPRDRAADLPQSAATAVMRAMNKKPEQRFASAGEFAAHLRV